MIEFLEQLVGVPVKVKKIDKNAKLPRRATKESACYDIFPLEDTVIPPKGSAVIRTGIAVELPPGWEMQIRPRSGYAFKHDVVAYWGTLDSDYTDEIRIKLFNFGYEPKFIDRHKAVAQVCVKPVYDIRFVEVEELADKGHAGFGSTDIRKE